MNHRWFTTRLVDRNSACQSIVSRCLASDSVTSNTDTTPKALKENYYSMRALKGRKEEMNKPAGRKKISVIPQHCYSPFMHLILCSLIILTAGVSGQQNTSSPGIPTEAPVPVQTSRWPVEWSLTESPVPDTRANSSTSNRAESIKSLVMETERPHERQQLSHQTSVHENQTDNSSNTSPMADVILAPTRRPLQEEEQQQDKIATFYQVLSKHQHHLQLSAPVNSPSGEQYKLENPQHTRTIYGASSGELEELPMELLHEQEPTISGDKLLRHLQLPMLNQPRQTRSNLKDQLIKSLSEVSETASELTVSEPQNLGNKLQSSLKPKHVEPPNTDTASNLDSDPSPAQTDQIGWSQLSEIEALLQPNVGPEYNFASVNPSAMHHVPAAPNFKQQISQPFRHSGKSLRQLASKFLKTPDQMYNRPPATIGSASRLIPKSIKSFFEPLTTAGTRLAPLVSGARRPKQLFNGHDSSTSKQQAAPVSGPQMPPLSLVMVNGQLYSVLSHNQPPSTASSSPQSNFDYQTSDTSEFPVFEAQSSNSGPSSSYRLHNQGCNRPRHIIHADRSVVNHILESQQNFVIARVPIKKFNPASSQDTWPNPIEQQIQQQQQLLSSQSQLYHAFPMQSLASSSQVVSAPASMGYRHPAVSIEVQANSPRPSIWQSFANFFSSLTRRRPSYTYLGEASNPSPLYSLDLPGSLYLGGGGRRWWHRRARRLDPLLMNAFRLLGSEPRYLEATQNRRTSSSPIDPMQRLLMLKTAYENEVCSPVAEVADKIKYSCLPNHCVASALASAAVNLEHQQSVRHQSTSLNMNDANSMLDYYLTLPVHTNHQNPRIASYLPAQSVLTNNYTTANQDDNSPLEVLQLDDFTPTQFPVVTYTHMNAYEAPALSRLAQPQHQHFMGGSRNLEIFAELDEPKHPVSSNNDDLVHRQMNPRTLSRYSDAYAKLTGRKGPTNPSKNSFYQDVSQQSLDSPSVSLGTIYQSRRHLPTSHGYISTQSPKKHADWSNFANTPAKSVYTEAPSTRPGAVFSLLDSQPNKDRIQPKTRHLNANPSGRLIGHLLNNDENDEPARFPDEKEDNYVEPKRKNRISLSISNQTVSTNYPNKIVDESRTVKTRRSRPQSALPRYGLRKASLPPPERELNTDVEEVPDQEWLRPGEDEDGNANATDCNCDKTTNSLASLEREVPTEARSDQLDKWRRATQGGSNHLNLQPVNQSSLEFLERSTLNQATKDRSQQIGKLQSKSQYNLRNTTYRNLQLGSSQAAIQDQIPGGSPTTQTTTTTTSTEPTWNSYQETSSIPSDISTTTASYTSTWSPGDNLSLEQSSQTNLLKVSPGEQQRTTSSTSPSIDEELQMIRELEEPGERLSSLGTGRPRIGGFNFKPLSVNEIIAQARRENQRSNATGSGLGVAASASVVQKTSGGPLKEEDDNDDGIVPHQYQIQIRANLQAPSVDSAGSRSPSSDSSQELSLDRMKEHVKDRLFEHREEEHWHEKKWLKGRKRRRLVDGKWVIDDLPFTTAQDIEKPIKLEPQPEANSSQEKHFAIPTPNFGHSAKFLDWVQRDVDMNEEPGEPKSHNQTV